MSIDLKAFRERYEKAVTYSVTVSKPGEWRGLESSEEVAYIVTGTRTAFGATENRAIAWKVPLAANIPEDAAVAAMDKHLRSCQTLPVRAFLAPIEIVDMPAEATNGR